MPLPSERCTMVTGRLGSVTPGFTFAMAASFHWAIFPRNRSASRAPVNFNSPVMPGML